MGADLLDRNLDAELLVPEDDDIPLAERVRRVNAHCLALGRKNVIVVSIHVNAAGNGTKWLNATGWSVFTCSGQTESDRLAERLFRRTPNAKLILVSRDKTLAEDALESHLICFNANL